MTGARIRVLVADDHVVARLGLAHLVDKQGDMRVVAQAATAAQAVDLHREHRPDITLMDLRMPGGSGVDAIEAIRAEQPRARIIVLTMHSGAEEIFRALRAGAQGYLLKEAAAADILAAIRDVHAGRPCLPERIASAVADRVAQPELSAREIAVLTSIGRGWTNKEIAFDLDVSESTVKSDVTSLVAKLGARDRSHALVRALERGILDLERLRH